MEQNDIEWLAGIVIEESLGKLLYEIWLKNGKAIAYEMYVIKDNHVITNDGIILFYKSQYRHRNMVLFRGKY